MTLLILSAVVQRWSFSLMGDLDGGWPINCLTLGCWANNSTCLPTENTQWHNTQSKFMFNVCLTNRPLRSFVPQEVLFVQTVFIFWSVILCFISVCLCFWGFSIRETNKKRKWKDSIWQWGMPEIPVNPQWLQRRHEFERNGEKGGIGFGCI